MRSCRIVLFAPVLLAFPVAAEPIPDSESSVPVPRPDPPEAPVSEPPSAPIDSQTPGTLQTAQAQDASYAARRISHDARRFLHDAKRETVGDGAIGLPPADDSTRFAQNGAAPVGAAASALPTEVAKVERPIDETCARPASTFRSAADESESVLRFAGAGTLAIDCAGLSPPGPAALRPGLAASAIDTPPASGDPRETPGSQAATSATPREAGSPPVTESVGGGAPGGESPAPQGVSTHASAEGGVPLFVVAVVACLAACLVLYRRLTRTNALEQSVRCAILDFVTRKPGTTAGEAARALGVDRHTMLHHLRVLHEFGAIETVRVGARARFFRAGSHGSEQEKRRIVASRSEKGRSVLESLAANPSARLAEVARATGLPVSTVHWHIARLRDQGLLKANGGTMGGTTS